MGSGADALKDAVARAYRAFEVPAPPHLGVCTVHDFCMDPKVEKTMLRKQQDELTLDEVRMWFEAATSDSLGLEQVCWIIPRVLEFLASGAEVAEVGNQVALARLKSTGFPQTFTSQQVQVVTEIAVGLLKRHIRLHLPDLDDLLCMFSLGGLGLDRYLSTLAASNDEDLANLLYANWSLKNAHGEDVSSIWQTGLWDDIQEREQAMNWYISPALRDRMTRLGVAGNEKAAKVSDIQAMYGVGC